jgi:ATP adenylyltransferase/5',5'''-P-1,P-4-tetraphosphate phosphorylase II
VEALSEIPIHGAIRVQDVGTIQTLDAFRGISHGYVFLNSLSVSSMLQAYDLLVAKLFPKQVDSSLSQVSLNVVFTKHWILMAQRCASDAMVGSCTIGVNALGCAGMFLVKTEAEMNAVRNDSKPLQLLRQVCAEVDAKI